MACPGYHSDGFKGEYKHARFQKDNCASGKGVGP